MTHHQNKTFLDFTDYEAVKEAVQEQINLLGSEKLYQRINNNLSKHKFEAFFAEEQFKLYAWRAEYFFSNFGPLGQLNTSGFLTWHSDGVYEEGEDDIVPYQITKNFDMVMAVACSPQFNENAKTAIYFKSDHDLSYDAEDMFNPLLMLNRGDIYDEQDLLNFYEQSFSSSEMSFSDVAHMIVASHRTGVFGRGRGPGSLDSLLMCPLFHYLPKATKTRIVKFRDAPKSPSSLLESSMKAILLHNLPLTEIPKTLQKKAREGLYSLEDSVPTDLTSEGRRLFNLFRDFYIGQSKEEEDNSE